MQLKDLHAMIYYFRTVVYSVLHKHLNILCKWFQSKIKNTKAIDNANQNEYLHRNSFAADSVGGKSSSVPITVVPGDIVWMLFGDLVGRLV